MSTFNFKQQLANSKPVVRRVVKWFQNLPSVYMAGDLQDVEIMYHAGDFFFIPADAVQYVEMKCESRRSSETFNLAIERYSNTQYVTIGGPWATRAQWYAHLYADNLLVLMNRAALLQWLTPQLKNFPTFTANNGRYVTSGLLVPRATAKNALQTHYREYQVTS